MSIFHSLSRCLDVDDESSLGVVPWIWVEGVFERNCSALFCQVLEISFLPGSGFLCCCCLLHWTL